MKLRAVIGAAYGDEGKGLVVDYLATDKSLVVRFNGGAQAGHTVVTPDGRSHEFHHVGAGTFKGARTLLSSHFIVNPLLFAKEITSTRAVQVAVDIAARVTTPFDMMLNVGIETHRGSQRHGSCGIGINETVQRTNAGYGLRVGDLSSYTLLRSKLRHIQRFYVPTRAAQLGITLPVIPAGLINRFIEDCRYFLSRVLVVDERSHLRETDDLIFEGAQGLRLDEKSPDFPYVTRSRTGLTNVVTLLGEANITDPLDVYYVTRCYTTRHGAGPLWRECDGHPYGWIGPEANVTNTHQGQFRYGALDTERLAIDIHHDIATCRHLSSINPQLVVTCLDQRSGDQPCAHDIAHAIKIPLALTSYGPTRDTMCREVRS